MITSDAIRELIQDYFDEMGADYICLVSHSQHDRLLLGVHNNGSLGIIEHSSADAARPFYIDMIEITSDRKNFVYPRECNELMGGAIDLTTSMRILDENVDAWAEKLTKSYTQAKAICGGIA